MRKWLRRELAVLDFRPIQKSVWFGPGPLPKKLIEEISERDLEKCIKYFWATKNQII